MNHRSRNTVLAAATALAAAGALSIGTVSAVAAPATDHCSAWKQVGSTKFDLRVCGNLIAGKKTDKVLETVNLKNTSKQNVELAGDLGVSWGQAGNGEEFQNVKVSAGGTKNVTRTFSVGSGPYLISAAATAGKSTARVHKSFKK